jgi:NitT/TauT family transport system substrate-binding protein
MNRRQLLAAMLALVASPAMASRAAVPIRVAVLRFGTVNWEIETIRGLGLDATEGVAVAAVPQATGSAAQIAFLGGEADALVADWLWVAHQRAAGRDVVFLPYSRAVGGIMVPPESDAERLADLAGLTVGIAGGPLDKSWLILRAAARAQGFDLAGGTRQAFAAPPLLQNQAEGGAFDAVVTYWHYMAKLKVKGWRTLAEVADAAEGLGLGRDVPLLGYVFHGDFVHTQPDAVAGFARASRAAKAALDGEAAWDAILPLMNADSDAEIAALKAGFRAGTPDPGPVDREKAAAMFALMAELGGEALVGDARELPDGVFLDL